MTDPAPLTDDEVLEYARKWPYHENDLISVVISRLVAKVEQTRKERDDAYACIRLLQDGYKPLGGWWDDGRPADPMSSAEIDAIRRARADTPGVGFEVGYTGGVADDSHQSVVGSFSAIEETLRQIRAEFATYEDLAGEMDPYDLRRFIQCVADLLSSPAPQGEGT